MDLLKICEQAAGVLMRRGAYRYMEKGDLIAEGYVAIIEKGVKDDALAVVVARAAMVDALRASRLRSSYIDSETNLEAVTFREEDLSMHEKLREAVRALPHRQYSAIMDAYWGKLTQQEIASDMGITQRTVSQILKDAKKTLRELLNGNPQTMNIVRGKIPVTEPSRKKTFKSKGGDMLLTLAEIARRFGVCDKTARVLVKDLPKVRVGKGNRFRYSESAVTSLIHSKTQSSQPERLAS